MAARINLLSLFGIFAYIVCVINATEVRSETIDDIKARLVTLEAAFGKVLEKNDRLEQRVGVLEQENEVLKGMVHSQRGQNHQSKDTRPLGAVLTDRPTKHKYTGISTDKGIPTLNEPNRLRRQLTASTVAFTAVVGPPAISIGPGQTVVFDSVITNVGQAYDNKSGLFTAPVSGVYVFNFAEMIDAGLKEYLEIVKDGVHVIWNYGHAPGATHLVSSSRTATLEVIRGSQVWVQAQNSGTHGTGSIHGNSFTTFSGWLIAINE